MTLLLLISTTANAKKHQAHHRWSPEFLSLAESRESLEALGGCGLFNYNSEEGVNTLVFGDYSGVSGVIQSRLFVGGNCALTGTSLGTWMHSSDDTLIVGGDLNKTAGTAIGKIYVGGEVNIAGQQTNEIIQATNRFDFTAAQTYFTDMSATIDSESVTGTVEHVMLQTTFTAAGTGFYEVFETDCETISGTSFGHLVEAGVGATHVINVRGNDCRFSGGWNFGHANLVLWNFPEATEITFLGLAFPGSILAPLATINGVGGVLTGGQFVAQGWTGRTAQHFREFHGCLDNTEYIRPSYSTSPTISVSASASVSVSAEPSVSADTGVEFARVLSEKSETDGETVEDMDDIAANVTVLLDTSHSKHFDGVGQSTYLAHADDLNLNGFFKDGTKKPVLLDTRGRTRHDTPPNHDNLIPKSAPHAYVEAAVGSQS